MKAVQKFSKPYLEQCRKLTPTQIAQFLDDFRQTHGVTQKKETQLISIKVEKDLLNAFKTQAKLDGVPYQTRIKKIMRNWLIDNSRTGSN
jgi:uncharacterized protein (DUF4415 family)